jgi:DinB superfamily
MTNPYAKFLGSRDARETIAATPARLAGIAQQLGPQGLERSTAPGKWSAREILCHLADCEVAFAFRLRQALAEPRHVIQPFDQEAWAKTYSGVATKAALDTFAALRAWNLALLAATPAEAWSKAVNHPERGDMTFQTIVETMGGHDLNHIAQLEAIAGQTAAAAH